MGCKEVFADPVVELYQCMVFIVDIEPGKGDDSEAWMCKARRMVGEKRCDAILVTTFFSINPHSVSSVSFRDNALGVIRFKSLFISEKCADLSSQRDK